MTLVKGIALLLATVTMVTSEPQSPSNTYLPPVQGGYNYPRPTVPFPSPGPSSPGPSPGPYPRPQPPSYRPPPTLQPSPTPTYGPPPTGPQGPPRPRPPYNDGGHFLADDQQQHHHDHHEPGMPFDFNYAVKDDYYGTDYAHNAISDGDVVKGEYRVKLPDGRTQIVRYTADWKTGFHADVQYEGQAVYPDAPRGSYNYPTGGGGSPSGTYGPPGPSSPAGY